MSLDFDLVPDAKHALKGIERIVLCHAFDAADDDWSEVQRDYEGDQAYVSFYLSTDPDEAQPSVRIELGVQDDSSRVPSAGFKAQWNREDGVFGQVRAIVVNGKQCSPDQFLRELESALALAGVALAHA
jgi:hypothetical protein